MAIQRVWHGWTTPDNAEAYEKLLLEEVFPGIEARLIPGYRGIDLMRRDLVAEVEFVTVMTFDDLQNVIDFQGKDYARAYVPESAQALLKHWDQIAAHYEVIEQRRYG